MLNRKVKCMPWKYQPVETVEQREYSLQTGVCSPNKKNEVAIGPAVRRLSLGLGLGLGVGLGLG